MRETMKPRARDLKIQLGQLQPGPLYAITDVALLGDAFASLVHGHFDEEMVRGALAHPASGAFDAMVTHGLRPHYWEESKLLVLVLSSFGERLVAPLTQSFHAELAFTRSTNRFTRANSSMSTPPSPASWWKLRSPRLPTCSWLFRIRRRRCPLQDPLSNSLRARPACSARGAPAGPARAHPPSRPCGWARRSAGSRRGWPHAAPGDWKHGRQARHPAQLAAGRGMGKKACTHGASNTLGRAMAVVHKTDRISAAWVARCGMQPCRAAPMQKAHCHAQSVLTYRCQQQVRTMRTSNFFPRSLS